MESSPIGLIAGGGQFPLLFAEAARQRGRAVVALAHQNEALPELKEAVDAHYWIKLGQLGKIIKYFHREGVRETVFCGSITKTRIFHDIMPDLRGLSLWNKIDRHLDDAILRAVAGELEKEGIAVIASTSYLKHLLFPFGFLSCRKPNKEQVEDIRFGWRLAKEIGRLDIGQCVVVRERSVLAVEAIEGTDAAILRGGKLGRRGAVVVKVRKPGQDFRFDLPATGIQTIETMAEVKAAVLAVEAQQSLLFDQKAMLAAADRAGIVLLGVKADEQGGILFP